MRKKKKFTMATGFYFFNVRMGYNNSIIISRKNKKEAKYAFANYLKQRKDCEWLGQWDGKQFVDTEYKVAA